MKIRWIGQSGYLIEDEATKILIDPYLSDIVNRVAKRPRMVEAPIQADEVEVDYLICTHDHLDHLDPDSIARMKKDKIHFLCPPSCVAHLKELGCSRITEITPGDVLQAGKFTITAVFACHTIEAIGILLEYEGKKLYFTGDTLYHEKLEEMAGRSISCLFLCINGLLGNMNVEEAVKLTKIIQPEVAIPNHYGMFASNTEDPHKYTSQLSNGFIMEYNREYTLEEMIGGNSHAV